MKFISLFQSYSRVRTLTTRKMATDELCAFVDSLDQDFCTPMNEKSTQTDVRRDLDFNSDDDTKTGGTDADELGEWLRFPDDITMAPPSPSRDVLHDISNTMDCWFQRVLDTESQLRQTKDIQNAIAESLQRQQLDGLLTYYEINELRYIGQLWLDLSCGISCYTTGCTVLKGRLISILLELFTMKQINSQMFLNICMIL